jgi:DNA-binding XRE family transcriptional regulator
MPTNTSSTPYTHSETGSEASLLDIDLDRLRADFKLLRNQYRLSQARAARSLRVSQATLSAFENGKHTLPRPQTILGIRDMVLHWKRRNEDDSEQGAHIATIPQRREDACILCGNPAPSLSRTPQYCPYCSMPYHGNDSGDGVEHAAGRVAAALIHSGILPELIRREMCRLREVPEES